MVYLIAASAALAAALFVFALAQLVPARSAAVRRRIDEVAGLRSAEAAHERRRRLEQRQQIEELLEILGTRIQRYMRKAGATREQLIHAGYRRPAAPGVYWGVRIAAMVVPALLALLVLPLAGVGTRGIVLGVIYFAGIGWALPLLWLRRKVRARQKEIILALPDALDLLVVCVEAGLGLNQALVRVAQEIHPLSPVMASELHLLNLEIRAGTPRDEALRNLFDRTGVDDIHSLTQMMIQADRFGTSIADALRIHSETLRDKRRQRAEEAAAKTTIKLVFPLAFCIFPSMFVVLVGPGFIQIIEALRGI